MTNQMSEEEVYEVAKKRVTAKKRFYSHLGAYIIVNTILIIIWALSGDATRWSVHVSSFGNMWFLWPLCIWGVFILINFLQVFVFKPQSDMVAVEKEVEKIKKNKAS